MQEKWEVVIKDEGMNMVTSRMRVTGGWIYRIIHYGNVVTLSSVFVPHFTGKAG